MSSPERWLLRERRSLEDSTEISAWNGSLAPTLLVLYFRFQTQSVRTRSGWRRLCGPFFTFCFLCVRGVFNEKPLFFQCCSRPTTHKHARISGGCVCACAWGGGCQGYHYEATPRHVAGQRAATATRNCACGGGGGGCLPRPHQCLRWIVVCLRAGGSGRRRLSRYLCVRVCFIVSTRACASEKVWPRGCGGYCSVCVRAFARETAQGRWRALLPRRWKTAFPEQICRLT